jgi:ribosomal protein S27E
MINRRFLKPFGQIPLGEFSGQSPLPQEGAKLPICKTMLRSCSHLWRRLGFPLFAPDLGATWGMSGGLLNADFGNDAPANSTSDRSFRSRTMSIRVSCPSCRTEAIVPDDAAGKKGKCRKCGGIVRVPQSYIRANPVPVATVWCAVCGRDTPYPEVVEYQGEAICKPCIALKKSAYPKPVTTPKKLGYFEMYKKAFYENPSLKRNMLIIFFAIIIFSHLADRSGPSTPIDTPIHTPRSVYSLQHDKAEEMRSQGFTGSDQDLAKMYDRTKEIDLLNQARRERLNGR